MPTAGEAKIKSRTGAFMRALYDTEPSGLLTVSTSDEHGYASAHMSFARERLGSGMKKVIDHGWTDSRGIKQRLTVWKPKAMTV